MKIWISIEQNKKRTSFAAEWDHWPSAAEIRQAAINRLVKDNKPSGWYWIGVMVDGDSYNAEPLKYLKREKKFDF